MTHPVHQHAYETAVAAQERGMLCCYVTGLYRTDRGLMSPRALNLLPAHLRQRVERELRRRWHPELDRSLVRTVARYHLPATALRRLLGRQAPHITSRVEDLANRRFDAAVASWLRHSGHNGLVHAFEGTALETFRAAKDRGLATVLDVPSAHEYYKEVIEQEGGDTTAFDTDRVRTERKLADYCLAPSSYVARCLTEHGVPQNRIVQIPYGVNPHEFRPNAQRGASGGFRALFVGKIGRRKGVRYLLEAWKRLSLPGAELVLVGPTDEFGDQLLHRYSGACRWVHAVPHHEVHVWFEQSDVFVFPSLAEGSAYVTYEALASGLPVVTTPNSGSVVEDGMTGFLVPPCDSDAVARSIRWLYENPQSCREMGERARASIAQKYTWKHYGERLANFYATAFAFNPRVGSGLAPYR